MFVRALPMTGAQHTCHARERTFGGGVMGPDQPEWCSRMPGDGGERRQLRDHAGA